MANVKMVLLKHDGTSNGALIFSDKGTVTQLTSNTTGVTLNASCGVITLFATGSSCNFILTNSLITTSSIVIVTAIESTVSGSYACVLDIASGSVRIRGICASSSTLTAVSFMVIN